MYQQMDLFTTLIVHVNTNKFTGEKCTRKLECNFKGTCYMLNIYYTPSIQQNVFNQEIFYKLKFHIGLAEEAFFGNF